MGGAGALLAATSHRALDKHGYWTVSTLYWSLLCEIAWIIAINCTRSHSAWTWTWMPYSALLSTSQFYSGRSWYFVKHCKMKTNILLKALVWNAVKMVMIIYVSTRYHLEKLEALLLRFLSLHLGHHVPALCKAPTQHRAALLKEMRRCSYKLRTSYDMILTPCFEIVEFQNLRGVPIWAFHGSNDVIVPSVVSKDLIEALWNAGASKDHCDSTVV